MLRDNELPKFRLPCSRASVNKYTPTFCIPVGDGNRCHAAIAVGALNSRRKQPARSIPFFKRHSKI
jgi:hypothetical protein